MRSFNPSAVILPFGIFLLAACADSTTAAGRPAAMTLSVTSRSAAAPSSALAAAAPITVAGGGNTLVINQVRVVLGEIELKQAGADCSGSRSEASGSGKSGRENDCTEVELDPMLVDVPLNGTATLDLGALVPAGTYRELEFKIENADDDSGPEAAFLRAHPEFRGVSVRVDGTFNGQPFTFKSAVEAQIEMELNAPLVVGAANPLNLTISIDVASWFKGAGGAVLDPSGVGNAIQIAQNIRASFAAFEDDDRDGVEDHRR
jgi:hypothetical protein